MDEALIEKIRSLMKQYDTNKADIFDLDGTVINGSLLTNSVRGIIDHHLCKTLVDRRSLEILIKQEFCFDYTPAAYYQDRRITTSEAIILVESGLFRDVSVQDLRELIYTGMEQIMASCYQISRTIILALRLRRPRKLVICVTGTPQEIADLICPFLGFDVVIGTSQPIQKGTFVDGARNIDAGNNKGKIMDLLSKQCGIIYEGSIAAGDSQFDYELLKRATYPLAINPKLSLQKLIRSERNPQWKMQRIAWIDQILGAPAQDHIVWLPNELGKLHETNIAQVLPKELPELMSEVEKRRATTWSSL